MNINRKYFPYIGIFILCVIVTAIRVFTFINFPTFQRFPIYLMWIGLPVQFMILSIIWNVVQWLNRKLSKILPFENRPVLRVLTQVAVSTTMFMPIFILSAWLTRPYAPVEITPPIYVLGLTLLLMMLLLMNFSFYAFEFFTQWKEASEARTRLQLQAKALEMEKAQMQFHHLQNQVNPHFLFNALASLDSLIHTNPPLAAQFLGHMSKVYRYVLQHKESNTVRLETELEFVEHYISLLNIRYGQALQIQFSISPDFLDRNIAPVTLQMLIDNAIKHNEIHKDYPLRIEIASVDTWLSVKNNKQPKQRMETSNGVGLKQLKELYAYLIPGKSIQVIDEKASFEVRVPLSEFNQ